MDVLEAYDWIRLTEVAHERASIISTRLGDAGASARDRSFADAAVEILVEAMAGGAGLLDRVRFLPEFDFAREEYAVGLIGPWVDMLERLLAGVTFHIGARAPLIEVLFPHRRFDALRRANLAALREFAADFRRRLRSSYVERLLRDEADYAFAGPVIAQILAGLDALEASESPPSELTSGEAEDLRASLVKEAIRAERALRQARLLVEAASLSTDQDTTDVALPVRPKKRSFKSPRLDKVDPAPSRGRSEIVESSETGGVDEIAETREIDEVSEIAETRETDEVSEVGEVGALGEAHIELSSKDAGSGDVGEGPAPILEAAKSDLAPDVRHEDDPAKKTASRRPRKRKHATLVDGRDRKTVRTRERMDPSEASEVCETPESSESSESSSSL